MSDMAKQARKAMKAKAERLGGDRPMEKVDSSTFTPPEMLNANVKTGMRPISRRAYKSGGKVQGAKGPANMGKSVRSGNKPMTADSMVNKDMKEANQEREGYKHIGGLKSGGRTKKELGGPASGYAGTRQKEGEDYQSLDTALRDQQRQYRPGDNRGQGPTKNAGATMDYARSRGDKGDATEFLRGRKDGGRTKKMGGGPLPASIGNAQAMMDRAKATSGVPVSPLASQSRPGVNRFKSASGFKKGGSAEKHEDVAEDKALIKKMVKYSARTGKDMGGSMDGDGDDGFKKGGRTARKTGGGVFDGPNYPGKVPGVVPGGRDPHARGGKTGKSKGKGKTNINIVIASGKPAGPGDMMGNPMGSPTSPPGMDGMPGGMPIPVPPPSGGPPMPMPMPIPMPGPAGPAGPPGMPMPRKAGGRAYRSYKDMDAGAGTGEGRLEKAEIASKTARISKGNY